MTTGKKQGLSQMNIDTVFSKQIHYILAENIAWILDGFPGPASQLQDRRILTWRP
jgi:hypothetical protein